MPPHTKSSAIVVGSGIAGAATAYFLARQGVSVELLESTMPAAKATGAADGAVSVASKRPGPLMQAALSGIELYRQLARDGILADLFKTRSTFIVATDDRECEVAHAHGNALAHSGVETDVLVQARLRSRLPAVSDNALMAIEVRNEGHAIGYQIVHRLLTSAPIVVRRHETVRSLIIAGDEGRIKGVTTAAGNRFADYVVIAAGGGSGDLLDLASLLKPRKGQLLVTERAPSLNAAMPGSIMSARYLLSKGSQKVSSGGPARGLGLVIDPLMTGQFLIGGTREDFGDERTNDLDAVATILTEAVALIPGLASIRLLRSFAGSRTAVSDGLPLIGPMPGVDNGFVVTGFEGDGICLGPVAGKAISELICGTQPSIDLTPFRPDRFAEARVGA